MSPREEIRAREKIEAVVACVRARLEGEEAALVEDFVRRYYHNVAPFDLAERAVEDLYGAALAHYRLGRRRRPGGERIRAFNPRLEQHGWQSTHTVVDIVTDDRPFLVDSVSMEIVRRGLGIHLVVHPVLPVVRDGDGVLRAMGPAGEAGVRPESWMHFEIDRHSDPAFLRDLERGIVRVLGDVRRAVEDWPAMRERVDLAIRELATARRHVAEEEWHEIVAFLRWLADDHFTFLGSARYRLEEGADGPRLRREPDSGLGVLRDAGEAYSASFDALPGALRRRAATPVPPVVVTKATSRSTVHRPAYLDYVGVKRYDAEGRVVGENRFLGLFTSAVYNRSPRFIPLLRRKIERVFARSGLDRRSHDGKALFHILETYPRDELFQIEEEELLRIAREILHLQDRQRIRLFVRCDPWRRFASCLVLVPRDRYNTALRERFRAILAEAFGSDEIEHQIFLGEAVAARVLFLVRTPKGLSGDLDLVRLEARLVEAARDWSDVLHQALLETLGEEEGTRLFRRYGRAFSAAYREAVPARAAVADVVALDRLARGEGSGLDTRLYRRLEESEERLHFRLVRRGGPLLLSEVLPILEHAGLVVVGEQNFEVRTGDGEVFWIHDFSARYHHEVDVERLHDRFCALFLGVWQGLWESDGFDELVMRTGLDARRIAVLRAYAKYALQLAVPFSQAYMERTLVAHAALAERLVALFDARFDPALPEEERGARTAALREAVLRDLEAVTSLDEDRILRTFLGLIEATRRTNVFRTDAEGRPRSWIAFKFHSAAVPWMPRPVPDREIFVYAPHVQGIHLRGGPIARGGIRWSDRREDFRTEVLGLMKAQMVKNAIIVPTGAKGGFVLTRPPRDPEALRRAGVEAYETFVRGLLDLTDDRRGDAVVPPPGVVRHDGDDPYLVVAADKGTATFSDLANRIAAEYGFWLGDAFASGGSAGYDHKRLGITARGAWESVRRHFRELGLDPDRDTFRVVGIGDMSGDVFGNGMLLSDRILLVAAFDHRHVFLDPDPDPARAFAERRRLFALPRSSWDDYDRGAISRGGGVWPRTIKRIPVSPEAARVLDIAPGALSPPELIRAILRAPVDLLWNGGIGTFVKAREESHAEVQDRANDAIRVDAEELRCRVVAEGGNLGFTQKARIVYALNGGRINTDFIDNSAGVDCSDHEVNIKIALDAAVEAGELTRRQRDRLLADMADEVVALVLRHNRDQNLALSLGAHLGPRLLDAQTRLLDKLEAAGLADRALDVLPDAATLAARRGAGRGLTRPERAFLLAHAKRGLEAALRASDLPDRAYLLAELEAYFPTLLRRRWGTWLHRHRLRREIVVTRLVNAMLDRGTETFVSQLEDETGAEPAEIGLGFVVTRELLGAEELWERTHALPATVPARVQLDLFARLRELFLRGTRWFVLHGPRPLSIREALARYGPGVRLLDARFGEVLPEARRAAVEAEVGRLAGEGIPEELARAFARLPLRLVALDVVTVTEGGDAEEAERILAAARIWFALHEVLGLDGLRAHLEGMPLSGPWDRLAVTTLEGELDATARRLAAAALRAGVRADAPERCVEAVAAWIEEAVYGTARYRRLRREVGEAAAGDLGAASVLVRALAALRPAGGAAAAR